MVMDDVGKLNVAVSPLFLVMRQMPILPLPELTSSGNLAEILYNFNTVRTREA